MYLDMPGMLLPLGDATNKANQLVGAKRIRPHDSDYETNPEDFSVDGMLVDQTCNEVRSKIRKMLDSGTMTKKAFCKEIGVGEKSLNGFLGHSRSMQGDQSDSYHAAWTFFKKRELAGVKLPTKKAAKKSDNSSPGGKDGNDKKKPTTPDISGIKLDGEEEDKVPIYETCDEVRRKLNAHLTKPGVTQAQFARELSELLSSPEKKVSGQQIASFRNKKGPKAGNTSIAFYACYVFFEKVRLAEKKPKSKHRQEMEERWTAEGGFDTEQAQTRMICFKGERPWIDKWGCCQISRKF